MSTARNHYTLLYYNIEVRENHKESKTILFIGTNKKYDVKFGDMQKNV
jgi:hypothetical protein